MVVNVLSFAADLIGENKVNSISPPSVKIIEARSDKGYRNITYFSPGFSFRNCLSCVYNCGDHSISPSFFPSSIICMNFYIFTFKIF